MKRLFYILCLTITLLTGCSNTAFKTEYYINELATIDNLEITMIDKEYNNNILEVTFKIKNKRNNTITISPDTYFKLYDINKVQIPNKYENDNNIIKKNETITIVLQYNIQEKSIYEILFYSGIVENNIKFTITDL